MLGQVKTIDGVKQIVPLTSDTRIGNPLGTIIAVYTTRCPSGYLPCDGSVYDTTQYPALYALLGSNHTPDLREVTLKGIGLNSNTTSHVSVSGLSVGDYLEDRVQNLYDSNFVFSETRSVAAGANATTIVDDADGTNSLSTRFGPTTEVKAVGVNYVIKATPGLEESQADYVAGIIEDYVDSKFIYEKLTLTSQGDYLTIPNKEGYEIASVVIYYKGGQSNSIYSTSIQHLSSSPYDWFIYFRFADNSNPPIDDYTVSIIWAKAE